MNLEDDTKWLEWVAKQFESIAGEDKEIDLEEFKAALKVKEASVTGRGGDRVGPRWECPREAAQNGQHASTAHNHVGRHSQCSCLGPPSSVVSPAVPGSSVPRSRVWLSLSPDRVPVERLLRCSLGMEMGRRATLRGMLGRRVVDEGGGPWAMKEGREGG